LTGLAFCFSPPFLYALDKDLVVPRLHQCLQSLRLAYIAVVSPELGGDSINILLIGGASVFVICFKLRIWRHSAIVRHFNIQFENRPPTGGCLKTQTDLDSGLEILHTEGVKLLGFSGCLQATSPHLSQITLEYSTLPN
jgi:hypothetical protein